MDTRGLTWAGIDDSDLAMVRDWLYPQHAKSNPYELSGPQNSEDMRSEALARINIWTFKTHDIPSAILATADLADAILNHERMLANNNTESYRSVQFTYAFAFVRFVNRFVDRDVAKTATASLAVGQGDEAAGAKGVGESSMYAHAAAIGMPSRFVDLRHELSHSSQIPEPTALRMVTEEALSWLWERWWKVNATGDPGMALRRFEARKEAREQGRSRIRIVHESVLRAEGVAAATS